MIIWPFGDNPIVLNTEETLIVTGISIVVLGVVIGFLVHRILRRCN